MRKVKDYLVRVNPWSLSAFVAALLAVAVAAVVQEVFASFGATLYFAAFFPAILAASLLAGAPAGVFAAIVTIPIVWWAFIPPHFEFSLLTVADYNSIFVFLLLSALMIRFCDLYREALAIQRQ